MIMLPPEVENKDLMTGVGVMPLVLSSIEPSFLDC